MTASGGERGDPRRPAGHWFDRLAVGAAEGPRMTRRASLQRAAIAVLAAGPLGALASRAVAADTCGGCHSDARQSFVQRQVQCFSRLDRLDRRGGKRRSPLDLLVQGGCYSVVMSSAVSAKVDCMASTPCQDGNPPGSPPPPQLPPTGTDPVCAACTQAGGKCCYGSDITAPCACIPPDRECKDFCS
jgi:hypothetical protein